MKKLALAFILFGLVRCFAADGVPVFQSSLQAVRQNGIEAVLNAWFAGRDDPERLAKIRDRFATITRSLGGVVDVEIFAPVNLGAHVQRLYGVIYFEKRPVWVRAEYYSIAERSGFVAFDFSLSPDDILPVAYPLTR